VKSGTLGVGGLDVTGNAGLTGRLTVSNAAPTLRFQDTDNARGSFIHQNTDRFYILSDRDQSNTTWEHGGGWPLEMFIGPDSTQDWARFSNRVLADRYCDENGANCFDPVSVGSGGGGPTITIGGICFRPIPMMRCNWNWSGTGNDTYMNWGVTSCQPGHHYISGPHYVLGQC
jgi:hypothetical protein